MKSRRSLAVALVSAVLAGAFGSAAPAHADGPQCQASYRVVSTWDTGFQAEVTVRSTGTVSTSGWTVSWVFRQGERVSSLTNAQQVRSTWPPIVPPYVRIENLRWTGALAPGQTLSVGVIGKLGSSGVAGGVFTSCLAT